jgi:hypothetical protein
MGRVDLQTYSHEDTKGLMNFISVSISGRRNIFQKYAAAGELRMVVQTLFLWEGFLSNLVGFGWTWTLFLRRC